MSDYDDDEYGEAPVLDPNIRRQLREAEKIAKEAAEAKAQLVALQREVAFTKAGIPETGAGALLRKAYDGEVTPEAIRQAAAEYQIVTPQSAMPNVPESNASDAELESMRRVAGAATGAGGTPPVALEMAFVNDINAANSETEVMSVINQYYRQNPEIGFFPKGF
jgi:hypothetical protein